MRPRLSPPVLIAVCLLAASVACVGPASAAPPPLASGEALAEAQDLYGQCKWTAAYRRFAELADAGDAEAAVVALLMHRYGERLYGQQWSASPSQIDHWTALNLRRMQALKVNTGE